MSELPEELRNILHQKNDICDALEKLANATGINYQAEISRLSDAYDSCGNIPPEYAELLDKRFAEAVKAARDGETTYRAQQEKMVRFAEEAESLIAAGELATLKEVENLEKNIREANPDSELLEKLRPLKEQLAAEEAAVKAAADAAIALAEELEKLCAVDDIAPLHDRKPGIENEFAQLANIPRQAALRYNEAHRKATIKLAQHYETLDLARWESYTRKLDLCAALEKMLALPEDELSAASKKLNDLREQWKNLGSVPKEKSEEINPRYLELTRQLQHRIDEYFARKRQSQKIAAAEKEKLCAAAEEMADSTDWKNTAEKMRDLQAQWKLLPRAGAKENELFQRFRAGLDKFFNARKTAFDAREQKFKASEDAKNALILEAENLTDPRNARQLREKFRNAGFAGKRDQELYQKFNAAMDKFFSAQKAEYASRGESARKLIAEIEELTAAPANAIARIREIREELRNLNCRETRSAEQQALRKFDTAFNEIRKEEQRRREENSDTLTMNLAMAYEAWKNGDTPALPETESLAGFGKLQAIAKLLSEAISGDEKAAAKLDKQVNSAMEERERICAEMEKLSGSSSDTGIVDLAAELRSAMLGDFGKGSGNDRASRSADPQKLCMEFAAAGIVMPAELEKFQQRFAKAKAIVFAEK